MKSTFFLLKLLFFFNLAQAQVDMSDFAVEPSLESAKVTMECEISDTKEWTLAQMGDQDKKEYMMDAIAISNRLHKKMYDELFQKSFEEITQLYNGSARGLGEFTLLTKPSNFKDCGLSGLEYYSINLYTGGSYRTINSYLRGALSGEEYFWIELVVDHAVSGMNKYKAYTKSVKRGTSLSPELLAQHEVGQVVTYKGFTSTTTNSPWGGHQFIILSKTGRFIAPLSSYYAEAEVLIAPQSHFLIIKKELIPNQSQFYQITMKEITEEEALQIQESNAQKK